MDEHRPPPPRSPEPELDRALLARVAAEVRTLAWTTLTTISLLVYLTFGVTPAMSRNFSLGIGGPPAPARRVPLMIANVGGTSAQQNAIAALGATLQDVTSVAVMNALPATVKGVWWSGGYDTATSPCDFAVPWATLSSTITTSLIGNPKFSGIIWISDEPHNASCPNAPADHAARTAAIHALDPSIKTYVVILNGSGTNEFQAFAGTHDYVGVDPYPCKVSDPTTCDWVNMENRIATAKQYWPTSAIVPVFQTFGQELTSINYYRTPTVAQFRELLARWDADVPVQRRPLQMAYGWKNQDPVAGPTLADYYAGNGVWPELQVELKNYLAAQTP